MCLEQEFQIILHTAEYGVGNCKPVLAQMRTHMVPPKKRVTPAAVVPNHQLIGALLWIARHSHPGVMQSVVKLSQFCTGYAHDYFLTRL